MGNVEVIYNGNTAPVRTDSETKARTRVAAYCRVSTDSDGQMTSLELQMSAFRKQIEMRPDWELVDIYADEGISGTGANKRTEFQRMILYNEKYVGDVMMQKKYTMDHLSHKIVKNKEHTLPSYYVRDHHEPIISRKQFERVQKIAALKSRHGQSQQYPYDDMLVCPVCGERLAQHKLKILDQGPAWFCDRNENSCGQYVVKTRLLDAAMLDAYSKVDMEEVRAAGNDAAQAMIEMKRKYPRHRTVEYFWLDELVNKITFGKALAMTVHWKYGGTTTVTLPVRKPQDDPLFVAKALRERREQNAQNKKPKKTATQKTEKYTDLADAFR